MFVRCQLAPTWHAVALLTPLARERALPLPNLHQRHRPAALAALREVVVQHVVLRGVEDARGEGFEVPGHCGVHAFDHGGYLQRRVSVRKGEGDDEEGGWYLDKDLASLCDVVGHHLLLRLCASGDQLHICFLNNN
jgi:hypothetical protein